MSLGIALSVIRHVIEETSIHPLSEKKLTTTLERKFWMCWTEGFLELYVRHKDINDLQYMLDFHKSHLTYVIAD